MTGATAIDTRRPRLNIAVAFVAAVTLAVVSGWGVAQVGPLITAVTLIGLALIYLTLKSVWAPFRAVVAIVCLTPFFVIPVSAASASPTLFEVAALTAVGSYVVVLILDRRERIVVRFEVAVWALLGGYLIYAFVLGTRFGAGADLFRLFFRFGLAFGLFWLTVQLVRTSDMARRLIEWIALGATSAATVALVLYAGGPSFTFRALSGLVQYGYPDSRVVRYIEDNPDNPMRAIGTGVDPNAFGGLLMVGLILITGLLLSRRRPVPAPILVFAASLCGLAMLLTFSRGAWIGALAGIGVLVWFRARMIVPFAVAGGAALLLLGVGATYVGRLEAGLRMQDPATIQRFEEYRNALGNIRRHPWFGLGFGDAPSPEFGVGVSSIYLLIAEQTGLVGLALFGLFCAIALWRAWGRFRTTGDDVLLTVGAAFVGMLSVGLVDHYYFNIRFAHMVALFWIVAGLLVALSNGDDLQYEQEGGGRWQREPLRASMLRSRRSLT